MAKQTISQRMGLEGAEEIKAILTSLGQAGEKAFGAIKKAAEQANPALGASFGKSIENFKTSLAQLEIASGRVRGAVANLGVAFSRFGASLTTVVTRVGLLATAALGAVAAFVGLGKAATETVDAADRAAQSLGLTIEQYSGLQAAAAQSSISQEEFGSALNRLNATLGKTSDALGLSEEEIAKNEKKLEELGVSARKFNGEARPTSDILLDIADKFAQLPDGVDKSALAIELFGKSGARLIPFLNGGRAGIEALIADAKAMGLVFTDADKKTAALADQGLDRLGQAILGARTQLGLLFAPAIAAGANFFANLIRDNIENIKAFGQAVVQFGTTLLADFIAILLGADDRVENRWLLTIRDGVVAFGTAVRDVALNVVVPAFELIRSAAELVASTINSVFGTSFTGTEVIVTATALKLSGALGLISSGLGILASSANLAIAAFRILAPLASVLWSGLVLLGEAVAVVVTGIAGLLGLPVAVVVAIAAAIAAALVAIYVYWDEIKAAAQVAWDYIVAGAVTAWDAIKALFNPQTWVALWTALADAAGAAWDKVTAAGAAAWAAITQGASDAWTAVYDAAVAALDAIAAYIASALGVDWTTFEQAAAALWQRVAATAAQAWEGIKAIVAGARDFIVEAFNNPAALFDAIFAAWRSVWSDLFSAISGYAVDLASTLIRTVGGAIDYLVGRVRALIAAVANTSQPEGEGNPIGNGFARGGAITGPGGPTADRIPIWASNGEFMMRAAAVKKLGLRFLYMLNSGRFTLEDILSRFAGRGFATGGLITPSLNLGAFGMPRFADGGLVTAGAAPPERFSIVLDGQKFSGLSAPADTIKTLERFARGKAIRSAGRMPRA